jgi:hypothetical protein
LDITLFILKGEECQFRTLLGCSQTDLMVNAGALQFHPNSDMFIQWQMFYVFKSSNPNALRGEGGGLSNHPNALRGESEGPSSNAW